MEPHSLRALTYEELKNYTNDFSNENLIGRFQFGKVYHGTVQSDGIARQAVTVKIWEVPFSYYDYCQGDSEIRMMDEYALLGQKKLSVHPGLMKLYGYCCEGGRVGVVYDFESKDTVQNLILKGGFTWLNRVKVAIQFADLLVFMHKKYQNGPFVIRNIDPSHIMVDKDYNPKLLDFGLVEGGIFGHSRRHNHWTRGCLGSEDNYGTIHGGYTPKTDVFAFGVLLTKLMSDDVDRIEDFETHNFRTFVWLRVVREYLGSDGSDESDEPDGSDLTMKNERTMVDACFHDDQTFFPEDGVELSKLVCDCVDDCPTMEEVLTSLLKLQIVREIW